MRTKGRGKYPPCWLWIAYGVKAKNNWACERCGEPHSAKRGSVLTVHHLDGDKGNCLEWNLAALCQRCHLSIQGRVFLPQSYMFGHSWWIMPHIVGYYKHHAEAALATAHIRGLSETRGTIIMETEGGIVADMIPPHIERLEGA